MQFSKGRFRQLALTLLVVGPIAFLLHESFHWLAGTLLGYPMVMTTNRAWSPTPMLPVHQMIVSAAGPLLTYAQAAIGYLLVARRASLVGFAMVYLAFFMRLVAAGVSMFNPNDEARISRDLGLGAWTLPGIVVLVLFVLVYLSSRRVKTTVAEHVVCYLIASVIVTLFVGVDYFWFGKA